MNNPTEQSRSDEQSDRRDYFKAFQALIFGACVLFFAIGLPADVGFWQASIGNKAGAAGFTFWLGAMSCAGCGCWFGCRWSKRINDALFNVASVAILVLFAWFALQSVTQAWAGGAIPTVGEVLSSIMFFVWSVIGLLICFTAERGSRISSGSSVLSWPFLLFMKSPIVASLVTLSLALFSGGGEFLGRALGYSMVGAWLGLALLAVLVFVTATGGWGRNDSSDPR